MIFKRKIYDKLLQWKETSQGRKALLIEGARRVGKSTVAEAFARNEYKSYLLIDFNTAPKSVTNAFADHMTDLDTFFLILATTYGVRLLPRQSLIIFDEIQRFPKARECMKYLVADGRYDYIETGSLVSIRENVTGITLPSEERRLAMHPMDFSEFALAMGEGELWEYIRQCFEKRKPLETGLHKRAMLLLRQYMIVGGMPKSVAAYIESGRDFHAADEEKRDILDLYRADIMRIGARYRTGVLAIFDQIPAFLSKAERRVVMSQVEKGATLPRYHDTFFWLADSMVCNQCFNCSDPGVGLSLNEDRQYVKCYMGDTGLLLSHTFNERALDNGELYRELLIGKLSVNEGMFYENLVAQMLVAAGHKLYFYTRYNPEKHRNDMEIDFLLSNGSKLKYKVYPVEVKSSNRYTTTSLLRFHETFRKRTGGAFVLHPKNLTENDGVLYLPAYMAGLL